MNARPQPKTAAEVSAPLPLSAAAKGLLAPGHTPRQFLDALTAAGLAEDAVRFLAAALPKRESVWWGCVCVRAALPTPAPLAAKAVAAAEAWAKDPTDANRRAAGAAGEAAGHDTPAGCLAAAAFLSGGSLTAANLPPVPPRDDLTGQAVAGAVLLAAAVDPPAFAAARAKFLAIGQQVATGVIAVGSRQ